MNGDSKPGLLYALAALVLLEGVALVAGTIYLVFEIFIGSSSYLATAIAYAVTAAVFAVLVLAVGRYTLRARPWIRGAVVCLAVLQVLLGYSILVSGAQDAALGWILVAPAVVMVVLLFTPPVMRATARPPRKEED